MQKYALSQRLGSEFLGTAFLLAAIVGSGIMAENLSAENAATTNVALELLCNSTATGAILFVMITMLAPISGAHFNPAVTLAFLVRREIGWQTALMFMAMQILGGIAGVWATHIMFDETTFQFSTKLRPDRVMVFRVDRHLRSRRDNTFDLEGQALRDPDVSGALRRLGHLVHVFDFFCKPCGYDRPWTV